MLASRPVWNARLGLGSAGGLQPDGFRLLTPLTLGSAFCAANSLGSSIKVFLRLSPSLDAITTAPLSRD
jgi:hypothetical protein